MRYTFSFFIIGVIVLLVSALGVDAKTTRLVLTRDTIKPKDFVVRTGEMMVLKNNAKLVVRGNLTVFGAIECDGGALNLDVSGWLRVPGTLQCFRTQPTTQEPLGNGIVIIARKGVRFEQSALVVTNGHIQLVDHQNKLATNQRAIDAIYERAGRDAGAPFQVGPLAVPGSPPRAAGLVGLAPGSLKSKAPQCTLTPPSVQPRPGIPGGIGLAPRGIPRPGVNPPSNPAPFPRLPDGKPCIDRAGNPVPNCVQIGGTWIFGGGGTASGKITVPPPPKNVKRIVLNFGFGSGKNVVLNDLEIVGPPAPDGEDDPSLGKAPRCTAQGEDGYSALRTSIQAPSLTIHNFILRIGKGGDGGDATTPECFPKAKATGGDGGVSGNLKIEAQQSLRITGSLCIFPGDGGKGGDARAYGKHGELGCDGGHGGSAEATGGKGGENVKELRLYGDVQGARNIVIGPLFGGNGGNAAARSGNGGDGEWSVGMPGDASATPGAGGIAQFSSAGVQRIPGVNDKDGDPGVKSENRGSQGNPVVIPCGDRDRSSSGSGETPPAPQYRFVIHPSGLPYGSEFSLVLEGPDLATKLPLQFTVLVDGRMQDLPQSEVTSADQLGTNAASIYIPQIRETWRGKTIEFQVRGNGALLATWSNAGQ